MSMYVRMYVFMYICVRMYVCMHACMYELCIYVCTYVITKRRGCVTSTSVSCSGNSGFESQPEHSLF